MRKFYIYSLTLIATLFAFSSSAFAHIGVGDHGSFSSGFFHPLTGVDHILVMIAVGLWAAQLGGRALWAVPLSFVVSMGIGFVLALVGVNLPFVEPVILASVVAIGLVTAMAIRAPMGLAMVVVGVFAVFHGHAHGAELGQAHAVGFAVGFALATVILHLCGIALGLGASFIFGAEQKIKATRFGGVITAIGGLYLAFAG